MNVNVYLPDELGRRAKDAELPLSQLLREAVTTELERMDAVSETLEKVSTHELLVEDDDGRAYTARLDGTLIARDEHRELDVYLTTKENVVVHDASRYWVADDPEEDLRPILPPAEYADAMLALGIKPTIDLDL